MKICNLQNCSGYSLIELVFVIVILAIVAVGLLPLFNIAITSAQEVSEIHQGQLLAQEGMSQIANQVQRGSGFVGVVDETLQIDLGGPLVFEKIVEVQGGLFNSNNSSLSCSGSPYNDERYKCVFITIKIASQETILAKRWTMLVR
ncbi:MAG: type II secretion system protein [Magnetococcales bacterium]|nr:type II secretion system protein [Magnetococcales bacterium]